MTERQPIKKGILSSLMGLFGEEEGENGREELEDEEESVPPSGSVVRESYEPGWYRVSAAQEAPPSERSASTPEWGSPAAEAERVEEAEPVEEPRPMYVKGSAPTLRPWADEPVEE